MLCDIPSRAWWHIAEDAKMRETPRRQATTMAIGVLAAGDPLRPSAKRYVLPSTPYQGTKDRGAKPTRWSMKSCGWILYVLRKDKDASQENYTGTIFSNKKSHELRPAHTITPKEETKKKIRSPTEALESHSSGQSGRQEGSTHRDSLQGSIHHLVPVAGTATLEEVGHIISTGEWSVGDVFSQEFTQRAPAIANLVLQQTLRWNQAADFVNVILVHLLALVGEVPAEEGLEELVQHRVVHAGSPAEVRNEAVLRIAHTPKHSLHDGSAGISVSG